MTPQSNSITHTENPSVESGPVRVRWGKHFYWRDPWNAKDAGRCVYCHARLYESDGHTLRKAGSFPISYRGVTQVKTAEGDVVDVHCDCFNELRKHNLVLTKNPEFKGARSAEWLGRWTEFLITEKLQNLGFSTFNSTESDSHVDILAMKNHVMVPIQVRSARFNDKQYRASLRIGYDNRPWTTMMQDVDFVVIVGFRPVHDGPECFVFPSHTLAGKQNIHFKPDGRYAEYRDAWYQLQHAVAGKRSGEFLTSRAESLLGWPDRLDAKAAIKKGDKYEISVYRILVSLNRIFDWSQERSPDSNVEFYWFLYKELDRLCIHELCHIFHDQIRSALVDDEEDTKRISEDMVYG